mmetsp:Transcript_11974/g.21591  ORF Transcript_11974/g.21591 Transcript_11974/m.21591 type:complete len:193 (+) Transcript_11974:22-600(+)|eukprot:CAMPEP_0201608724 /NCGR_PEP_ID=MMETSP0492-20130828/8700_1 /ASSEMBLY_ACC=CAM_ASM_000837 /TAXON_ID=420259 /ORGANISM="Thalassiosira gravida, Strain GMp14c1" /LENGTH=192 /DNA_ID=CAMNT_0048073669 /DNA_START=19 /DNA_END=597 /DNA_ORIENTATION=+
MEEPRLRRRLLSTPTLTMVRSDSDSSSENDTGPALPSGVLRSRGGWEDAYNIEMEHQREKLRAAGDEHDNTSRAKASSHAAVDLAQFRNEEVGKGYQAKHVVRQREASSSATGVVDMSGGKFSEKKDRGAGESSSAARKRNRDGDDDDGGGKNKKKDGNKGISTTEDVRLESYLKCKGMRDFMKGIDQIFKQ